MKKLIIILSLFITCGLNNIANSQNVNVNINIGSQPAWGPTGYDYAGYYYFPDLNIYFDVNSALFYYLSGSNWISNQYLPDKYRKYDLYSLYKVVVNDSQPWKKNKNHKKEYSKYKGDKTQTPIRYSSDSRYNSSKNNTNVWVDTNRNQNNKQQNNKGNNSNKNTQNQSNKGYNSSNNNTQNQNSGRQQDNKNKSEQNSQRTQSNRNSRQ